MSPPLRDRAKQDQLWRGLAFNDLQCIRPITARSA
jgi:dihydroorotase-like cyclic amidohydrolase